jgi:hypothetical protein
MLELPLDGGTWHVAVLATQPGDSAGGAYALRRRLVVGSESRLALSDIVTGLQGQPAWRADDGPFPVNSLGAWPAGSTVDLWYELRGIAEGADYRSTIEVRPVETRLGDPITFAVNERSTGQTMRIRRTVDLDRLRPGRYVLMVQVESGGESVMREQEILVVDRE